MPDPVSIDIEPENIPLDIIYEDDDVILVNKPKGMVVHPAPGHYSGTLVNGLMYHFKDSLSGINGEFRPWGRSQDRYGYQQVYLWCVRTIMPIDHYLSSFTSIV